MNKTQTQPWYKVTAPNWENWKADIRGGGWATDETLRCAIKYILETDFQAHFTASRKSYRWEVIAESLYTWYMELAAQPGRSNRDPELHYRAIRHTAAAVVVLAPA